MKNILGKVSLLFLVMFVAIDFSFAQTFDFQSIPSSKMHFGFSLHRPSYQRMSDISFLSGVFQLKANIPITSKINIVGEIPYVNISYETNYGFGTYKYERMGFGNVFVGVQLNPESVESKSVMTLGVFLPTADELAAPNGLLAHYYEINKFMPNTMGLYYNYAYHHLQSQGFNYAMELGPNVMIPTKQNNGSTELFLHYGLNAGYRINKLFLNMEFVGVAIVTQDVDNFGDRLLNAMNFGAQWKEENIALKVFYKYYLKESLRDVVKGVMGIAVSAAIN